MTLTGFKPHRASGFSLAELAIVLVIVGMLLAALMAPLGAQREQRNIIDTKRQLDDIREALLGYLAAQGRLPCPATATLADSNAAAGQEVAPCSAGATPYVSGVLPWKTLGLKESDAWARRYGYTVTKAFANPGVTLTSAGVISVLDNAGGNTISNAAAAIVVSHGANGAGAYLGDGSQLPASADASEVENANADNVFVSKNGTDTYDDLMMWLSPNILFNRLVAAGRLP